MPEVKITAQHVKNGKETIEDMEEINEKTKKLIKVLKKLNEKVDEKIFKEAEQIFKKHFFQLKHSKIKRALSETEIRILLRKKNGLNKIIIELEGLQKHLTEALKYTKQIYDYYDLYHKVKIMTAKNKVSKGKDRLIQAQENLLQDYKKMQELAKVLKSVADKAPPFIKDYMKLTLDVFIKAEGAIKFFMKYGQRVMKHTKGCDNLANELGTDNVNAASGIESESYNDLSDFLDMKFKNKRYRRK